MEQRELTQEILLVMTEVGGVIHYECYTEYCVR